MISSNKKINILVIHGPNLNLLGEREPDIYGRLTLKQLNAEIKDHVSGLNVRLKFFQSNHEGDLVDYIHRNRTWADGIVINPGALTHYSYSLRDAIAGVSIPAVEVHLSDVRKREPFRKISVIRPVCIGQILGKGRRSYFEGVDLLMHRLGE